MILVTVGTHEQPFDRLIRAVDTLIEKEVITDEVIFQIGYGQYLPQYGAYSRMFSSERMHVLTEEADVLITHGGPFSFMSWVEAGRVPILVPRQKQYDEHVNDHQLHFARMLEQRGEGVLVVENIEELGKVIRCYPELSRKKKRDKQMTTGCSGENFLMGFKKEMDELLR